jgi:hypothetical protein
MLLRHVFNSKIVHTETHILPVRHLLEQRNEIGRASCRERVS